MSFKAFIWAWDQPLAKDEHLIVLLALADIANDAGMIRASQPYIAKKARKTERTVRRALQAMEGTVLTITERPGWVDIITLNIPDEFMVQFGKDQEHAERRGRPRKRPDTSAITTGHERHNEGTLVSDDPMKGTKEGTAVEIRSPDAFDIWWAIYPRKVAKVAARKVWRAVQAKIGIEDLAELTRRFADHVVGTDPQYIAHPAKWLKDERWNDELTQRGGQIDGNRRATTDHAARRADDRLNAMVEGARIASTSGRRRWSIG